MRGVYEIGEADADSDAKAASLARAAAGDQSEWRALVDEHSALVWSVARMCSWSVADAEDVYQATWLLLAENLGRIRDPRALPGWLSTTVRREAFRLAKARRREPPAGVDHTVIEGAGPRETERDGPEKQALHAMLASRLWQEFGQLPQRCQQLLRIMAVAPETSYAEVSEALGIPRGSIGPKKNRCLVLLRQRMGPSESEEVAG